jgi:hypothetical protein
VRLVHTVGLCSMSSRTRDWCRGWFPLRPGVTIPGRAPLDLAHGDIHCVFLVLARPIAAIVGIPLSTAISPAVRQRLVEQSPFSVLSPLKKLVCREKVHKQNVRYNQDINGYNSDYEYQSNLSQLGLYFLALFVPCSFIVICLSFL